MIISKLTGGTIPPIDKNPDVFSGVMTIKGVMNTFGIRTNRTVLMRCYGGRLDARKLDAIEGEYGGVWLITAKSAYALWSFDNGDNSQE